MASAQLGVLSTVFVVGSVLAGFGLYFLAPGPLAATVYVDENGKCAGLAPCFLTIQAGVDNASAGDTVSIFPGTYEENVDVFKPLELRAYDLFDPPVVDGRQRGSVFYVGADDVTLLKLQVTNGTYGISVLGPKHPTHPGGSNFTLDNTAVTGNVGIGVMSESGVRRFQVLASQVMANGEEGLNVFDNYDFRVVKSQLSGNGQEGLQIQFGSGFDVGGGTSFEGNGGTGLAMAGIAILDAADVRVYGVQATLNEADGLYIQRSTNCTVSSGTFSTNTGAGIRVEDSTLVFLSGNDVTGNAGDGINVTASQDTNVTGNSVGTNGGDGIAFWEVDPSLISGNTVYGNAGDGVNVSSSQDITVSGNMMRSNGGDGIAFWEVDPSSIQGNGIIGSGGNGISVGSSNYVTVSGNNASVNGGDGIAFWEVDPSIIFGNAVAGNGRNGINVSNSQDILVDGNTADTNGGDGIAFWEVDPSVISNNTVTGNGDTGVRGVRSNNITVSGNTIGTNGGDGIAFWEVDPSVIVGNAISGSGGAGVNVSKSQDITVAGNTVGTSGGDGIAFWEVDPSYILGNTVTSSGQDGVNVSQSQAITVGNNSARSNGGDGIAFWEVDPSFIFNNDVSGNGDDGIAATSSQAITVSGNNASANGGDGIAFWEVDPSFILDNRAMKNRGNGILLLASVDILVRGNSLGGNLVGLRVEASDGNAIYKNNFYPNGQNLLLLNASGNVFDTGCYGIGNYWSDYGGADDGTLVGRCGEPKIAGDGIGDSLTPHLGFDYYPVMEPDGWLAMEQRLVLEGDILPRTGNQGSQGKWVSVKVHVPGASGRVADDIEVSSLLLFGNFGSVPVDLNASTTVSRGPAGETTLHAKFDRQAWSAVVVPGEWCFAIIGRFSDGQAFIAVARVRVTDPP